MNPQHGNLAPSAWVRRWSALVPAAASVLDVACGAGRHVRWFAGRGAHVTALDCDSQAVAPLRTLPGTPVEVVVADIENAPWPLPGRRFDAVVVTNYLWRPLLPTLLASVGDGGVLIYETFARGNETVGKPSNPAFLLGPGELMRVVEGLRVIAFEDGFLGDGMQRFVQRVVAVREPEPASAPPRYALDGPLGPAAAHG